MLAGALVLLLPLVLIASLAVSAAAQPMVPDEIFFFGNVYVDGQPPPEGTRISAEIAGVEIDHCLAGNLVQGKRQYGYDIEGTGDDDRMLVVQCSEGDTIVFYVGGRQDGTHLVQGFGAINLDLVVVSPTPTPEPTETPEPTATPSGGDGGGNGGGGVPPPTDTPEPSATPTKTPTPVTSDIDLSGVIDGNGVVQQDVHYSAPDGMITIDISSGTVAQDEAGEPLQGMDVELMCFGYPQPPAGAYVIGCAYNIEPEGATFEPPITLTLAYDPGLVPANVTEVKLVIAYYDQAAGTWVEIDSAVDTMNKTITVEVSHLTMFAVYYQSPSETQTPGPTPVETETPAPTATPTPVEEGGTNVGVIIGLVIAVVVVIIIAFLLLR